MGILLASGAALMHLSDVWRRISCPLRHLSLVDADSSAIAAVDNTAHLLWHGGTCLPCPHDVEALRLWNGFALVLSSNTDCLSVTDGSDWLVTAKAGVYPQDMCLVQNELLICGGADGLIHRLSLPELHSIRTYPVPGMPQRIHAEETHAYILCTVGDEMLHTHLCHLDLCTGSCLTISDLPGIPGAVCSDRHNGVWAGTTKQLCRFPPLATQPDVTIRGLGLPSHLARQGHALLVTDPIADVCLLITQHAPASPSVLWRGEVTQGIFC